MKGFVYTGFFVLLIFLSGLIINLNTQTRSFNSDSNKELLLSKKSFDDYETIYYNLLRVMDIDILNGSDFGFSFPFSNGDKILANDVGNYTNFINQVYATARFSTILVDTSTLVTAIENSQNDYTVNGYNTTIEKKTGDQHTMWITGIIDLTGIEINILSDANVTSANWQKSLDTGSFVFNFSSRELNEDFVFNNNKGNSYFVDLEKNMSSVGAVEISFEPQQDRIRIRTNSVNFGSIDYLNFTVDLVFPTEDQISFSEDVTLTISDYLGLKEINITI